MELISSVYGSIACFVLLTQVTRVYKDRLVDVEDFSRLDSFVRRAVGRNFNEKLDLVRLNQKPNIFITFDERDPIDVADGEHVTRVVSTVKDLYCLIASGLQR